MDMNSFFKTLETASRLTIQIVDKCVPDEYKKDPDLGKKCLKLLDDTERFASSIDSIIDTITHK